MTIEHKSYGKMKDQPESYAKKFIEDMRKAKRCDWCGRVAKKNRKGLCRSCNDVRKELEKAESRVKAAPPFPFNGDLPRKLKVAEEKKRSCIAWGKMQSRILDGRVIGLDLEKFFCRVAGERIGSAKKIHSGRAGLFGLAFTVEQKQLLAYVFWEIFGAEASRQRSIRAMGAIFYSRPEDYDF